MREGLWGGQAGEGDPNAVAVGGGRSGRGSSWWVALVFAGGVLGLGMLVAGLSFAFGAGAATEPAENLPPVWPPDWVFWAVWVVIYPTWGVATWLVWRRRREEDVRGAMACFGVAFVPNLAFLPISAAVGGNPVVLSVMDAVGLATLPVMVWLYARHSRAAVLWLLPIVAWLPVTLTLKVWTVLLN